MIFKYIITILLSMQFSIITAQTNATIVYNWHEKNPGWAFSSALVLPGLGHIYSGEIGKGLGLFGGAIVGYGVMSFVAIDAGDTGSKALFWSGFAVGTACYLYSLFDSPFAARRANRAKGIAYSPKTRFGTSQPNEIVGFAYGF